MGKDDVFDVDNWLINTKKFAELVNTSFDEEELRQACFDLEVDYDNIPGRTKKTKIQELITYYQRRGNLWTFFDYCRENRSEKENEWKAVCSIPEGRDERPPYKGLQSYTEDDALYFFGREKKTAIIFDRLNLSHTYAHSQSDNFLAIIGASGSGKSSLVRAGLVAAIERKRPAPAKVDLPAGCEKWPVHILTPTDDPLESLISSFAKKDSVYSLKKEWYQDHRSLHLQAKNLLSDPNQERLLLVVDQFEELFTLCQNEKTRSAFIGNLVEAVRAKPSCVIVVITLRADFYHLCAPYEQLCELLAKRQEFIGGMTEDELHQVIEQPATQGKWELEPGLIERILDDVGREPGILPLLSHVLHETWRRRNGRQLTLWGYEDTGGVQEAISATADKVYDRLSPEQQKIARYILLRLTAPGSGDLPNDTRRPVPLEELLAHSDPELVQNVLDILAQGRLVTMTADAPAENTNADSRDTTVTSKPSYQQRHVEIAHEALIRYWKQFQEWLETHRKDLQFQRRLTADALDWQAHNYDNSYLYRGQQLDMVLVIDDKTLLNSLEQDFLQSSITYTKRQRLLIGGTGALLISLLVAFFWIVNNRILAPSSPWQNVSPDEEMVMSAAAVAGHGLWAGTENTGVWHSEDGQTWSNVSQGIPDITVISDTYKPAVAQLAVDALAPERLLAFLTEQGVYERQAAALPWQPFHDGLPSDPLDGALDIAVHGPLAVALYATAGQQQVYVRQFTSPWRLIPPPGDEVIQQVIHIGQTGDTVYLGTNKGLYRASVADEWIWEQVLPKNSWVHEIEPAQQNDCGPLPLKDDCLYLAISNPQEQEFAIYRWSQAFDEEFLASFNALPWAIIPAGEETVSAYAILDEDLEIVAIHPDGDVSTLLPFPDGRPAGAIIWVNPDNNSELLAYRNSLYQYEGSSQEVDDR